MSDSKDATTQNEFEEPGTNYPDSGKTGRAPREDGPVPPSDEPSHVAEGIGVIGGEPPAEPDHHGQDGGRDTLTVSEAQSGLSGAQEQRLPSMSQNNASEVEKVAGIVAQTRADVATMPQERVADVLAQRLAQAGIALPDEEIAELARQVTTGDAVAPDEPGGA